jgi:2-polyprenyl-3-methyl-5-hydroxy-6-metoxy-1,4-benzoquinol methylase
MGGRLRGRSSLRAQMAAPSYHERIWEAVPEGLSPPRGFELRRRFLLAQASASLAPRGEEHVRVLDVGCGEARLAQELSQAGFSVVGIDVAEEPLRRARARHPRLDLRVVPACGEWPLADSSFDLVWAGDVVEHVTDTLAFISEARRVLRSGGTLALATPAHTRLSLLAIALSPARGAFEEHFDPRSDHVRFYSRRSLWNLLSGSGFEDVDVRARGGRRRGAERVLLASARRSRFAG